jgi:hypothetical protein
VRQLIKRILKEEKEKDLSSAIKELLNNSIGPKYKGIICKFDAVAPWKMYKDPINRDYQVMVSVIGGVGSNRWPNTQHLVKERDKIVNETWHTIYNYLGISTDVFLRNVKSCDEVLTESSNERLEKLIGDYISMSYPTAQKIKLAPPGVDGSITTFTLPDPQDERDNLIFKFDVFGKPEYNINPEFFSSISSMFGKKRNIKKIILKWFEDKEVDVDLMQDSKKEEEPISEGLHDTSWQNDEGDKITLIDLLDATEKIPVRNISVNKIKPKLLTWNDDDEEIAKIEKSDLQYPILIFVDDDGNFISIIDGHHRAQKAVKHKLKTIKAKLIPINSLPKNIGKVFKHLNKKGESLNESKMLDYLKQFLSGEVLDNYRKEKGRKEFQKMVDMVYKITAKDTPIEGMVGVLVGHIDKSMWGTTYTDPNSVGSRWDFKVILKPLFTNYNPNNEQDYNDRVLNFEEDFNRNARGMGFELISPIQHDKVKNYKVTFEWASRLDVTQID